MNKVFYASSFMIVLVIGILFYYLNIPLQTANASISLKLNDKNFLLQGRDVYVQNCASCHGVNLEGQKDWMSRLME